MTTTEIDKEIEALSKEICCFTSLNYHLTSFWTLLIRIKHGSSQSSDKNCKNERKKKLNDQTIFNSADFLQG